MFLNLFNKQTHIKFLHFTDAEKVLLIKFMSTEFVQNNVNLLYRMVHAQELLQVGHPPSFASPRSSSENLVISLYMRIMNA